MRLIYHPDAEAELIAAAQYYEGRVGTLGVQFLDDADHSTSELTATLETRAINTSRGVKWVYISPQA